MTTPQTPTYDLQGSLFIILTSALNKGKSTQMLRALRAKVPGTTRSAVGPTALLVAEASSEGTLGEFMADPSSCLVCPVTTCDDAVDVLRLLFPEGRGPLTLGEGRKAIAARAAAKSKGVPPPPAAVTANDHLPLRSIGVESISTLHEGQMNWVRDSASAGGPRNTSGRDLQNDRKRQAGLAAGPTESLVNMLSGLTQRHRGTLVLVACHTRPQEEVSIVGADAMGKGGERVSVVVGEAPDFGAPKAVQAGCFATGYAALWSHLAAKANAVWHLYGIAPDLRLVSATAVNDGSAARGVRYGAITQVGTYPGLGHVGWVKRQGCDGAWLTWFNSAPIQWDRTMPWGDDVEFRRTLAAQGCASAAEYDGGPHLGAVLELCIAQGMATRV